MGLPLCKLLSLKADGVGLGEGLTSRGFWSSLTEKNSSEAFFSEVSLREALLSEA